MIGPRDEKAEINKYSNKECNSAPCCTWQCSLLLLGSHWSLLSFCIQSVEKGRRDDALNVTLQARRYTIFAMILISTVVY